MHAKRIARSSRSWIAMVTALLAGCGGGDAATEDAPTEQAPAAPTVTAADLVGTWTLVLIDMEDGEDFEPVSDAIPELNLTAEANPTGSRIFSGSGGCNRMMGGYDAGSTGRITFASGAAMTMMACPDPIMRVEQMLAMGLEAARTYEIDADRLSIDFGGGVLVFERSAG